MTILKSDFHDVDDDNDAVTLHCLAATFPFDQFELSKFP